MLDYRFDPNRPPSEYLRRAAGGYSSRQAYLGGGLLLFTALFLMWTTCPGDYNFVCNYLHYTLPMGEVTGLPELERLAPQDRPRRGIDLGIDCSQAWEPLCRIRGDAPVLFKLIVSAYVFGGMACILWGALAAGGPLPDPHMRT